MPPRKIFKKRPSEIESGTTSAVLSKATLVMLRLIVQTHMIALLLKSIPNLRFGNLYMLGG